MHIKDVYRPGQFTVSVEIFPPKTPKGNVSLFHTLDRLSPFRPAFVSCTYGAGGTTRDRTTELCVDIQKRYGVTAIAHLTCVGATCDELLERIHQANRTGIQNMMALRGDPSDGQTSFQPTECGLQHANELVSLIRKHYPQMGVGVGGYPEKHVEAPDPRTDLENLKRKVDAGADAVFTQLFYSNASFLDFRKRYERMGIDVPLVPGIMPVTEFARIKRITSLCGARFPNDLAAKLEAAQHDPQTQFDIGVDHAIQQCHDLIAQGVPGIHFYALNRSRACERILESIGKPSVQADCA